MKQVIRFFEDILGYFMEKFPPSWKFLVIGGLAAIVWIFWSFKTLLNVVSVVLWLIAFFMFGKLLFNVVRDRNKETPK